MATPPLEVTLRDVPHTDAIERRIRGKANKLGLFYEHIEYCKVTVEIPQKHKHQGKLFQVNIELGVPGNTLVVNHKMDEDLYVAIRDAFAAMKKQLEYHAQRQRGDVKTHPATLSGRIARLFMDYGFIEGLDGRELYFNEGNMVHPKFDDLGIGMHVQFIESMGDDGLQANHISVVAREE